MDGQGEVVLAESMSNSSAEQNDQETSNASSVPQSASAGKETEDLATEVSSQSQMRLLKIYMVSISYKLKFIFELPGNSKVLI